MDELDEWNKHSSNTHPQALMDRTGFGKGDEKPLNLILGVKKGNNGLVIIRSYFFHTSFEW